MSIILKPIGGSYLPRGILASIAVMGVDDLGLSIHSSGTRRAPGGTSRSRSGSRPSCSASPRRSGPR